MAFKQIEANGNRFAEYFPKKDRAFATSIFNAGASVGALAAPVSIPPLAEALGWEMAFIMLLKV